MAGFRRPERTSGTRLVRVRLFLHVFGSAPTCTQHVAENETGEENGAEHDGNDAHRIR